MNYKEMIKSAESSGLTSEKAMWTSVNAVDGLLAELKHTDPKMYYKFMRTTHESLFGKHYDQDFAEHDVDMLHYTDSNKMARVGEHWTIDEVVGATRNLVFSNGVTKWDKYVAFNVMYSDLCREMSEPDILKVGYAFFFKDEDWSEEEPITKIWDYMSCRLSY